MGTLGELLKITRENKGLTLKDIADKTRISINFLKALEEEDFPVIPGDVFVTGFLRTYAKELGLDEKEVLALYKEIKPPAVETAQQAQPVQQKKTKQIMPPFFGKLRARPAGRKFPLYTIIIAGVVLGAVLTGIILLLTPREETAVVKAPPARPAPAPAPPFKPVTAAPAKNISTAAPPMEKAQPVTAPLHLKLTAEEVTWYSYRADDRAKESGILEKGKAIDITAKERIALDLGNAGGVKAEFNGKELKPFGRKGESVKNITFAK